MPPIIHFFKIAQLVLTIDLFTLHRTRIVHICKIGRFVLDKKTSRE
jgi:hypothetical protein